MCRAGSDFQEWIRYDLEYLEKRSLRIDLRIIWQVLLHLHQPCYSRAMPITEPITDAQQKELAMQWKRAAPFLAQARRNDIRRQNNAEAIDALDEVFQLAMKTNRRSTTSGFVKMYEVLMRSKG